VSLAALFGLDAPVLALLVVAGFFGFLMSAIFGIGGALLLIPIMMIRLPAAQAVAISAPVMLFSNILKAWVFRRSLHVRATVLASVGAIPAAGLTAYYASNIDDRLITVAVGVLILGALVLERLRARPVVLSDAQLAVWGVFTGAVSGIAGAAGPPTALGLKGYGLEREAFVATVSVYAIGLQLAKIPGYVVGGLLTAQQLPLAGLLAFLATLAVVIAPHLLRRLPSDKFRIALDGLLLVTALWLLVDAAVRYLR
jgi:uncharacterized membrane protein YfcA